jgi:hypothetical protein
MQFITFSLFLIVYFIIIIMAAAPMWNENSQVYQLDFGGRVTQESAKNFQIEFRGKQVSVVLPIHF